MENNERDFGKLKVQLRDGHHRIFGAINAGEKYVMVDIHTTDPRDTKILKNKDKLIKANQKWK